MFDLTIKTPSEAATKWLITYVPNPDARQWMKFGSPIGFGRLMSAFEREWLIDGGTKLSMASRFVEDSYIRLGREMATLGTPEFAGLACLKPGFAFDYQPSDVERDPKLAGKWRIAPQETTLDHLVWAAKQGKAAAVNVAAAMFLSYYNSIQWPYLRTGGSAKQPYMNRGRCRTARGCVAYCRGMLEILEDVLGIVSGKEHAFLTGLLNEHIQRIHEHWPLVDDPAGDHLPVPFMSFYQTASLWSELESVNMGWVTHSAAQKVEEITSWIEGMVPSCRASSSLSPINGIRWYYDIAIVNKVPAWHEDMSKQVTDINGVAAWAADLVRMVSLDWHQSMIAQAYLAKWPEQKPDLMAQFFGTVS